MSTHSNHLGSVKELDSQDDLSNGLIILDFSAEWCSPCNSMYPIFVSAAQDFNKIRFIKVDIQKNVNQASEFNVQSVPTIVAIFNGKEILRTVGAFTSQAEISAWIKNNILNKHPEYS